MRPQRFPAMLALTIALQPGPAIAEDAATHDHLDCAATYQALSLSLPYLPGVLLMFSISPRSATASGAYLREANPVSRDAVRHEVNHRRDVLRAAFDAGEISLETLVARAHRCDAHYGLDPSPVTLGDLGPDD